jgi:hypothetical protein
MFINTPTVLAAGLVLLVVGVQSVSAGDWKSARSSPYSKLFQAPPLSAAKVTALKPLQTCGTAVAPADPRLDARMLVELKKKDTRYTMRVIPPPICR